MKKYTLPAQVRSLVGRKVRDVRSKGEIPGTIYGKDVKSISISVGKDAFTKIYSQAGETGLVELSLGDDMRPVLIHTVQKDPVSAEILHIELYQVNLKQKVKTKVPLEFTGDAPAIIQKVGVLLTLIDEVEVEALPTDLPEKILVDVTKLAVVDDEIKVSDLQAPNGVVITSQADLGVIRVGSLISKEAEAQAAEEAAAAAAAAAEAPAAETPGETPQTAAPESKEEPEAPPGKDA